MKDRRALILGSCKGDEDSLSPQRVTGLMQRLSRVLGPESPYGFSLVKEREKTLPYLYNPRRSGVVALLEELADISADTELLLYFVGHSKTLGANSLEIYLGDKGNGDASYLSIDELIGDLKTAGIKKLFLVIDGCHASNCATAVNSAAIDIFAIYSSDKYAFNGNFTDAFIRAAEQKVQRSDQRIDRRQGGITFQKLFESARANLRAAISKKDAHPQVPGVAGQMGHSLLLSTPPLMTDRYNPFATSQSVYGRIRTIISVIDKNNPDDGELFTACQRSGGFLLRKGKAGDKSSYVSRERFHDYTDFLISGKLVVKPNGRYQLTSAGQLALNLEQFNRHILSAIQNEIFPTGLTFELLDEVIKQLLDDLIPPTPSKIEQRLQLISPLPVRIDSRLRFAFQILPATGRFLKGSADALFLAEV